MSKIGTLRPVYSNNRETLVGEINTLQIQLPIALVPNAGKTNDDAPDYLIVSYANQGTGKEIEVGSAWLKRKTKIGDIDFEFLSITIDDPSLPSSLNVAAFKNNQGGWDITWRRRQQGRFGTTNNAE